MATSTPSEPTVSAQDNSRHEDFKQLLSQAFTTTSRSTVSAFHSTKARMSSMELGALPATTWSAVKARVSPTELKALPANTWTFIRAHPYKVAYFASNIVFIAVPGLIVSPVLGLVGFGAGGPVAGTAATAWQAASGPIAARGLFATLQSAAMGGYGVTAVHGIVQGLTAVAGIGGLYSWKRGGGVNEDESSNVEVEEIEGEVEGGDWESVDTTEYDEDAEESVGLKAFGL